LFFFGNTSKIQVEKVKKKSEWRLILLWETARNKRNSKYQYIFRTHTEFY